MYPKGQGRSTASSVNRRRLESGMARPSGDSFPGGRLLRVLRLSRSIPMLKTSAPVATMRRPVFVSPVSSKPVKDLSHS